MGTQDPFFWFLIPLIGVICVGVCTALNYVSLALVYVLSYALSLLSMRPGWNRHDDRRRAASPVFVPSSPRRRMITTAVLLFLVSTFIPYQFALPGGVPRATHHNRPGTTDRFDLRSAANLNFFNYAHSILILMLWVPPINLPILVVWVRNLAVHWLTPSLPITTSYRSCAFIFLVETLTTGKMVPRVMSRLRHVTSLLLLRHLPLTRPCTVFHTRTCCITSLTLSPRGWWFFTPPPIPGPSPGSGRCTRAMLKIERGERSRDGQGHLHAQSRASNLAEYRGAEPSNTGHLAHEPGRSDHPARMNVIDTLYSDSAFFYFSLLHDSFVYTTEHLLCEYHHSDTSRSARPARVLLASTRRRLFSPERGHFITRRRLKDPFIFVPASALIGAFGHFVQGISVLFFFIDFTLSLIPTWRRYAVATTRMAVVLGPSTSPLYLLYSGAHTQIPFDSAFRGQDLDRMIIRAFRVYETSWHSKVRSSTQLAYFVEGSFCDGL